MPQPYFRVRNARRRWKYMAHDALAAAFSWLLFYGYRKLFPERVFMGWDAPVEVDLNFYFGLFALPLFWLLAHNFSGYYRDMERKSRLAELSTTIFTTLFGTVVLFFALFLDDVVNNYKDYYINVLVYIACQFFLTWLPRLVHTTLMHRRIRSGKLRFPALLIGDHNGMQELFRTMHPNRYLSGNHLVGYLAPNPISGLEENLPYWGNSTEISKILKERELEDVVISMKETDHQAMQKLITDLHIAGLRIRIHPNMYDIVSGTVRFSNLFETPLIEVHALKMPDWQQTTKRLFDVLVAATMLLLLAPLFLVVALLVSLDSRGGVFYSHERIGLHGKPFQIFKFRSMVAHAEAKGPALSKDGDRRITRIGRWMRKYRVDELPQFYNVLKGDMSLVGPRPERQYFIDQIVEIAPQYVLLHRVRPGITSWGQVKYGYAENVSEMVDRLTFDLLYLQNVNLLLDIKILAFTVITVLRAEGK